ncbi:MULTISPECIES: GDSL-type esterase/lipase family protein [unclassified Cryobacterium]|uniref:GDSL-type esterase/lipase family protein n=1 Tax=unclassified Cryobacterium TaxID=2649013 RepID=UPI002AB34BC8|nr:MULTISPECIES: SGNH/GDSL hydrolase family protein [unclassified Cryobacterium]MDY7541302.1 SGNH/GDSL hydrolase family protein [Cryobacterium sp. 5B3]MEA9998102.1 SGNH/GDSL hydrolase family protein [Cryobacterium sp. RTS3]MEB0266528.1 SGNH/GDSL hydrolase family protein [Cryobacterium sp. 10I5]MEB0273399.1 SGNH/GDSL hydrolase family protein [Cryobacterium sp. 5B3]
MSSHHDWITTPIIADLVRGALDSEQTVHGLLPHRLPAWARGYADPQLATMEAQPSGVRLAFSTRATDLELDVLPTKLVYLGAPPRPVGVYELLVDGRLAGQAVATTGITVTVDMATGATTNHVGPVSTLRFTGLPDHLKTIEIWLPHNERTELVSLRSNGTIEPAPATGNRVWLHHGSSISHGSNAVNPTETWPALAASSGQVDLVNLGFGGSALLDPFIARTMRDTPADLISAKIGINLVNLDLMRLRAFAPAVNGFLDTIRDGHPATPLLLISPILCPIHEDIPGPGAFDRAALAAGRMQFVATGDPAETSTGKLTLTVIRTELARIARQRAATDPNLHYLDGLDLYGAADFAEHPLPDRLHPDAATHHSIAERFARLEFGAKGAFAA